MILPWVVNQTNQNMHRFDSQMDSHLRNWLGKVSRNAPYSFRLCIRFLCLWYDMITGTGRSDSQPSFISPRTRRSTRDLQRSTRATWPRKTAYRRAFWAWARRWQVIIYRMHAPDALKNSWCTSFDMSLWFRGSDLETRSCLFLCNLTDFWSFMFARAVVYYRG